MADGVADSVDCLCDVVPSINARVIRFSWSAAAVSVASAGADTPRVVGHCVDASLSGVICRSGCLGVSLLPLGARGNGNVTFNCISTARTTSSSTVNVDFAVVNLVPPTFIVMGPDDASDERFCILAGGSPLLVEDMITRYDENV